MVQELVDSDESVVIQLLAPDSHGVLATAFSQSGPCQAGEYVHAADASLLISAMERGGATPEIVALKGERAVFINETNESDHLSRR